MALNSDAKFEEKLTCGLKNDLRNLANFYPSINGISSDLKLLKYFNGTVIVSFFRILLACFGLGRASVFPNN